MSDIINKDSTESVLTPPPKNMKDFFEITRYELKVLGFRLNNDNNFIQMDKYNLPIIYGKESVARRIYLACQLKYPNPLNERKILLGLDMIIETSNKDSFAEFRNDIKYNPTIINNSKIFIDELCGTEHNPLYDIIMNHIVWCVKRRIFGLDVDYPLWVNFSGNGNIGKTKSIEIWMRGICPEGYVAVPEDDKDSNILSNMEKHGNLLSDNFAVVFGELSGLSKVEIAHLKNLIDKGQIQIRKYFTQDHTKATNNAQLISTANTHLKDIFPRDEHIRKYCNIIITGEPGDDITKRKNIVNSFDFKAWITSIDENGSSPLSSVYNAYLQWVMKDCYAPTDSDIWIMGYIARHLGLTIPFNQIYSLYEASSIDKKWSRFKTFPQQLLRHKCEKVKRKSSGIQEYIMPDSIEEWQESDAFFDLHENHKHFGQTFYNSQYHTLLHEDLNMSMLQRKEILDSKITNVDKLIESPAIESL